MASELADVANINPTKDNSKIIVKIIRLWFVESFKGCKLLYSLEMVVMDAKGTKIHITVKKTLIYKFKRLFREGDVYSIAFFGVSSNSGTYKTTRHNFKINLNMNSEVQLLNDVHIELSPYTIVSFPELSSDEYDTIYPAGMFLYLMLNNIIILNVSPFSEYPEGHRTLHCPSCSRFMELLLTVI